MTFSTVRKGGDPLRGVKGALEFSSVLVFALGNTRRSTPTKSPLWTESKLLNFGDLGQKIQTYVASYQKKTKTSAQIESIDDMQRFVEEYPEFRALSGNVAKHVEIVHELSRLVDSNGLLEVSQLEQELACHDDAAKQKADVLKAVGESSNFHAFEKLRIALLFALRYEQADPAGVREVTSALMQSTSDSSANSAQQQLLQSIITYAGAQKRHNDLFGAKQTWVAKQAASMVRGFRGTQNVFTQHRSLLQTIIRDALSGRLKESAWPCVPGAGAQAPTAREAAQEILVFVVGGVTFQEARDVQEVVSEISQANKNSSIRVTLGGTSLLNARAFLADVAQLARLQQNSLG